MLRVACCVCVWCVVRYGHFLCLVNCVMRSVCCGLCNVCCMLCAACGVSCAACCVDCGMCSVLGDVYCVLCCVLLCCVCLCNLFSVA